MKKAEHRNAIILRWSAEDETCFAEVPELLGCAADGASCREAIRNAEVVIDERIETTGNIGRPVPESKGHGADAGLNDGHAAAALDAISRL